MESIKGTQLYLGITNPIKYSQYTKDFSSTCYFVCYSVYYSLNVWYR